MNTAPKLDVGVAPATAAPSPARPSSAERAAARLAKAQAQLKAAKQYKRQAQDHQAEIVGRAVIVAMRDDAQLRSTVLALLRRAVTGADRAEIAPLFIEPSP
jgi:hypothetical protein